MKNILYKIYLLIKQEYLNIKKRYKYKIERKDRIQFYAKMITSQAMTKYIKTKKPKQNEKNT